MKTRAHFFLASTPVLLKTSTRLTVHCQEVAAGEEAPIMSTIPTLLNTSLRGAVPRQEGSGWVPILRRLAEIRRQKKSLLRELWAAGCWRRSRNRPGAERCRSKRAPPRSCSLGYTVFPIQPFTRLVLPTSLQPIMNKTTRNNCTFVYMSLCEHISILYIFFCEVC